MDRTFFGLVFATLMLVAGCEKIKGPSDEDKESGDTETSETDGSENGWGDRINESMSGSKKWLTDMYESAKESGTTTANSVSDWVAEDWKAQGDWEYNVLDFELGNDAELVDKLNELGQLRWECFHVEIGPDVRKFYLKRTRKSYLKNLPLKEVMEFLPTGEGGN